ncbi:MAG: hypothetical protein DDT35_01013 [Firmicutes bacterium]|nr:hypothetical protein [Bacillota bacterium]
MRSKIAPFGLVALVVILVALVVIALGGPGPFLAVRWVREEVTPPVTESKGFAGTDAMRLAAPSVVVDRKVVTHSQLAVTVPKLDAAQLRVLEIVTALGGYVQSANFNSHPENQFWAFIVRIPSDQAAEAMQSFSALGTLDSSSTNRQDVTEEFIDLEARLSVMRQEETRLLELLRRANTIDDFLKVESHLTRVRTEIEQTTGRLKFLTHSVDMATLSLRLTPERGTVLPKPVGFAGLGARLSAAYRQGQNTVVEIVSGVLVFVTTMLPLLVLIVPALLLILMLYRRYKK